MCEGAKENPTVLGKRLVDEATDRVRAGVDPQRAGFVPLGAVGDRASARTLLRNEADSLRRRADRLDALANALPGEMSTSAELALTDIVLRAQTRGDR